MYGNCDTCGTGFRKSPVQSQGHPGRIGTVYWNRKYMLWLIGDTKLPLGVSVSVRMKSVCPVMNQCPAQGVFPTLPLCAGDGLQCC